MRLLQITVSIFLITIFQNCTSTKPIIGRYTYSFAGIAGEEIDFIQNPNTFEFYSRTEYGLQDYSSGTWTQCKKKIFLFGFNESNLKILDVKCKIEESFDQSRDKVVVQYRDEPLDTFTKVDIIVNGSYNVRIPGDTTFLTDASIRTLQVKSYLVHEGISFGNAPRVDTLYSRKIEVSNTGSRNKMIFLKFDVDQRAFYRSRLSDSLMVKNNRTFKWRKAEFKKLWN